MTVDTPHDLASRLQAHFESPEFRALVPALAEQFKSTDYAEIPDFLPPEVSRLAEAELADLYASDGRRRDILVPATGNTPRYFSNLDRDALLAGSAVIPAVFHCPALLARLSEVAGEEVLRVPYEPEEFISSKMERPGDVHGWHWDDYTYAVVWLLRSTPPDAGGDLEFVRGTSWDKADPRIADYLAAREVERRHPPSGAAYLLKTDTSMHRVTPVREGVERLMVCYTFCSLDDLDREISHETMDQLHPAQ